MSVDFALAACAIFLGGGSGPDVSARVDYVRTEGGKSGQPASGTLEANKEALRVSLPGAEGTLGAGSAFLIRFDRRKRYDLNERAKLYTTARTVGSVAAVWRAFAKRHGGSKAGSKQGQVETRKLGDGSVLRIQRAGGIVRAVEITRKSGVVDLLTFSAAKKGPVTPSRFELDSSEWEKVRTGR